MTDTSAIIDGLDPDTAYEIQVRSNSAAGDGAYEEWAIGGSVNLSPGASDRGFALGLRSVNPAGPPGWDRSTVV